MDKKRDPKILKRKKLRQAIIAGLAVVGLVVVSVYVSGLEPAAPSVERNTLWYGTVVRGELIREVRGAGNLVPEEIRWITARTAGRVEEILLLPGADVQVGTPILRLENEDLRAQMNNAEMDWKTAQAQLENQVANLQTQRLSQQNAVADAQGQLDLAEAELQANRLLAEQGLVADLQIARFASQVEAARNRLELAKKQLDSAIQTEASTLAPVRATVEQARTRFEQIQQQVADLVVKSTMRGQLQAVNVEVGAQMGSGAQLVRVSDPTRLKAEIRIPETQTRDLAIGLPAMIDTRNGNPVRGHVSRIDPASTGGTVGVDVIIDEPLPPNARVQMSVDGIVQLQKLDDVLKVESPAFGQENQTIQLFRVDPATNMAHRVPVKIGVRSVQFVEVVEGLEEGDRVVLSDMSQYDAWDRIQIRN